MYFVGQSTGDKMARYFPSLGAFVVVKNYF